MIFLSAMMIPQFKAGAVVMKISWPGSGALGLSEDAAAFEISAPALRTLERRGLPTDVLAKLRSLEGEGYSSKLKFQERLGKLLTPEELRAYRAAIIEQAEPTDWLYYLGLGVFALTVVGYTLVGGFLAAVWTDLLQSVMMFIGVVVLFCLALVAAGGMENATQQAMANTSDNFAWAPAMPTMAVSSSQSASPCRSG